MNDGDDMTHDEMRKDLKKVLPWLQRNVGEWAVRDSLKKFTAWGNWKGGEMFSLDEATARQVVTFLKRELEDLPDFAVEEAHRDLEHYVSFAKRDARRSR